MYKDQNQLEIIENVYLMQLNNGDANKANEKGILYTGGAYWLANPVIFNKNTDYYCVRNGKGWVEGYNFCLGIRPVVTLKQGVYIKSGTGVEGNPYVLEKE